LDTIDAKSIAMLAIILGASARVRLKLNSGNPSTFQNALEQIKASNRTVVFHVPPDTIVVRVFGILP